MIKNSPRNKLVAALCDIPHHMRVKLDSLQEIGAIISTRNDAVWYMLVQSMSGMGSNRGYDRLMLNKENFIKVSWATIKAIPRSELIAHIYSALSDATVRMPEQKAMWLASNFDRIEQMGGLAAALERKRALSGKSAKLEFFRQFIGIGEKYGRNIWMDLCDPDFRDSIAIDDRLKKIFKILGISTDNYLDAEQRMLEIAFETGMTGWELDRLLFHFSDHFIAAINDVEAKAQSDTHVSDTQELIDNITGSVLSSRAKHFTNADRSEDSTPVFQKWERIYKRFLKSRNTSNLGKKAGYVKEILKEFSGRIPLAYIVDSHSRKELSIKLFDNTNDFNFVIYPLGMGLWIGVLGFDGEHLVVIKHGLL
jgi:hypothetical protein